MVLGTWVHTWWQRHRTLWRQRHFVLHAAAGLAALIVGVGLSFWARTFVADYTSYVVPDLLLDHLPTVNVNYLFFQGAFLFILFVFGTGVMLPEFIPFTLFSSALFFTTRSFFMIMTHLSAPVIAQYSYITYEHNIQEVLFTVSSGNDLFFSAHAGYPFLLALIFWRYRNLRYFLLAVSAVASAVVILGHLHYSIDVFSAFFISYGLYVIAQRMFTKAYQFTTAQGATGAAD
jgi:hypothetical protein